MWERACSRLIVRISSNPQIIRDAVSPRAAVATLQWLIPLPGRTFWPDEIEVTSVGPFALPAYIGHRQTMDAYLLTLARQHDGKLTAFDRGIFELIPEPNQRDHQTKLIEA